MKNLLKTDKGILTFYSIIVGGIALLCLFFLFIGIYEISSILGISGFLSFFVLLIMLKGNAATNENGEFKTGSFIGFTILRVFLMILAIVLSAILIYFTNESENKFRFLYVLIAIIPSAISIILFTLRSKEGNGEWCS